MKASIIVLVLIGLLVLTGIIISIVLLLRKKDPNNLGSEIGPNVKIQGSKYLKSENGKYRFSYQDGFGVLKNVKTEEVIYKSCGDLEDGVIYLQNDGNLMQRSAKGSCDLVYHFQPPTKVPKLLRLTNDGELQLVNSDKEVMWVNGKATKNWIRK